MAKKVIIIGAVALGPKVACRLRRLDPDTQITVIDRDNLISYGGCGIPYYIGGDITDIELPENAFALWHDRAVFHFLTDASKKEHYISLASQSVRVGGAVIVATLLLRRSGGTRLEADTTSTWRCLARPARPLVRRLTTPSLKPRTLSRSILGGP